MNQAAASENFIQVQYQFIGQIPHYQHQRYWKIYSDGRIVLESHKQEKALDDSKPYTSQLAGDAKRFQIIEQLLQPLKALIGKECISFPTVSAYWTVQWGENSPPFSIHARCLDGWAKPAYQHIKAANRQILQWFEEHHQSIDKSVWPLD